MMSKKFIHLAKNKTANPHKTAEEMMSRWAARGLWRNQVRRAVKRKGQEIQNWPLAAPHRDRQIRMTRQGMMRQTFFSFHLLEDGNDS
jgi:hypothetical protein